MVSKLGGQKAINEYCSPEIDPPSEAVEGIFAKRRPFRTVGKADVLWEETATCTTEAAGIRVLASKERFAEITTGKSYFQMGWQ